MPSIFEKAATYLRSFALDHPFFNGNKRTALMVMIMFLELNGYDVNILPDKLLKLGKKVVKGKLSKESIMRKYLEKYCKKKNQKERIENKWFVDMIEKIKHFV